MSFKFLNENLENICMSVISESTDEYILNEKKNDEDKPEDEEDKEDEGDEDDGDENGDSRNQVKSIFGGNVEDPESDEDQEDEEDADAGDSGDSEGEDQEEDDEDDSENSDLDDTEHVQDDDEEDEEDSGDYGSGSDEFSDLKEFGVRIMMFATLAHFWHLNCDKNSQHSALDDLYNDVTDDADKIIESVLSYTGGKILSDDGDEFDFGTLDFNVDDDIDIMKELRDDASDLASRHGNLGGIANELGDLCEHLDKAIYKLSQFSY